MPEKCRGRCNVEVPIEFSLNTPLKLKGGTARRSHAADGRSFRGKMRLAEVQDERVGVEMAVASRSLCRTGTRGNRRVLAHGSTQCGIGS
jgi:hypothetical protein